MNNGVDDARSKTSDRGRSRSTSQMPVQCIYPDEVVHVAKSVTESLQALKSSVQANSMINFQDRVAAILMQLRPLLNLGGSFSSPELLGSIKRLVSLSKTLTVLRLSEGDKKDIIDTLELVSFAVTACVSDFVMSKAEKASSDVPRRRGGSKSKSYDEKQRGMDSTASAAAAAAATVAAGADAAHVSRSSLMQSSAAKRISELREDEPSGAANDTPDAKQSPIDASVLMLLDFGVEIALERAKRWSIVAKAILSYVEKQALCMAEYARQVNKVLLAVKPIFLEQTHTPLQQAFLASVDYDQENCDLLLSASAGILKDKFLVPISETLNTYNKRRKQLKEIWYRQMKAMQDAINATEKAHFYYVTKRQQLARIREQQGAVSMNDGSQKLNASVAASSGNTAVDAFATLIGLNAASKADKKRKLEEEALHKLLDAEAAYKASVAAADRKHEEVLQLKLSVLKEIEAMMLEADTVLKQATVDYIHLRHESAQTAPSKLERVGDLALHYEPGSEFTEFLRTMKPIDVSPPVHRHDNCTKERNKRQSVVSSTRVSSMHSSDSQSSDLHYSNEQISTISMPTQEDSDSESIETEFAYVQPEFEESPIEARRVGQTFAPKPKTSESSASKNVVTNLFSRRKAIVSEKTTTEDGAILECSKCGCQLTPISQTCGRCGTSVLDENRKPRRWFGVDLHTQIGESETGAKVPAPMRMCLEDIEKENRGITMQGIYRISGVKSRIDRLAEEFEQCANADDLRKIDLLEQQPHTVANLVKLYLRQLPEPLLTSSLCNDFVEVGKKYAAGGNESEAVAQLAALAQRLPLLHYDSASFLFSHLKRICGQESVNQMSASNLSIVFAPNLLRHTASDDRYNITDVQHQTKVVELLIQNVDKVFVPRVDVSDADGDKLNGRSLYFGSETNILKATECNTTLTSHRADCDCSPSGFGRYESAENPTILRRGVKRRNKLHKQHTIDPINTINIVVQDAKSNYVEVSSSYVNIPLSIAGEGSAKALQQSAPELDHERANSISGERAPSAPATLQRKSRNSHLGVLKMQSYEDGEDNARLLRAQSSTVLNLIDLQSIYCTEKSRQRGLSSNKYDSSFERSPRTSAALLAPPVSLATTTGLQSFFSKFTLKHRRKERAADVESEYVALRNRAQGSLQVEANATISRAQLKKAKRKTAVHYDEKLVAQTSG